MAWRLGPSVDLSSRKAAAERFLRAEELERLGDAIREAETSGIRL